jgi:predicted acetyltransferase
MIFLNEPARRALWKFVANHDSMIDKVTLTAPVDDRLPYLLDDPRIKQEVSTYFMGRIVDVAGFVERYRFAAGGSEKRLTLRVEDAHAPWNDGAFDIAIESQGKATVRRSDGEAEWADEADKHGEASRGIAKAAGGSGGKERRLTVSCTIQTLTALLFGYQKAGWLRELGRLEGSQEALEMLESILPDRTPFLLDSF